MKIRAVLLLGLLTPGIVLALDLMPIPPENAQPIGAALAEQAGKIDKLPAKIAVDLEHLKGLISDDQQQGLMLIPAKDIKDDPQNPALAEGKGVAIGMLFFSNLLPGDLKDKKKLFEAKYTDDSGSTREIRFGVLTVHKESDDSYKLQLWGLGDKPVAEGNMEEEASDDKAPVALDYNGDELEITLLGKYPASFTVKQSAF